MEATTLEENSRNPGRTDLHAFIEREVGVDPESPEGAKQTSPGQRPGSEQPTSEATREAPLSPAEHTDLVRFYIEEYPAHPNSEAPITFYLSFRDWAAQLTPPKRLSFEEFDLAMQELGYYPIDASFEEVNELETIKEGIILAYGNLRAEIGFEQGMERKLAIAKKALQERQNAIIRDPEVDLGKNATERTAALEALCATETADVYTAECGLRDAKNERQLAELDVELHRALLRCVEAQIGVNTRSVR